MATRRTAARDHVPVRLVAAPPDGPPHRVLRGAVVEALAGPPGPELLTPLIELAGTELSARERTETVTAWRAVPSGSVHDCAPAPVVPGWGERRPGWSGAAGGTMVEPRALHDHDAA